MASSAGNICTRSTARRPERRPLNRNREKANAAQAETNTDSAADSSPMTRLLANQRGKEVSKSTRRKFSGLAPVGMSCDELSVPSGLSAADTTKTIGKREKA